MTALSTSELADMQEAQEGHMMDTCILVQVIDSDDVDSMGHPLTGDVETESECGLDQTASKEWLNAEARVYDAKIRLPIDTDISNVDHLRITKRFGVAVDELRYEFLGDPMRGPSGLVSNLRSSPNG